MIKASSPRTEFGKKLIGEEQRGRPAVSWMNEQKRIEPKSTELLCSFSVGSCTTGPKVDRTKREYLKIRYLTFSRRKRVTL